MVNLLKVSLLLSLCVLGACQKKDSIKPYTPHVAGQWVGTGTDDAIGFYNVSFTLTQDGDTAAGTFTMAGGVATVSGDAYLAIGPQGPNNLRSIHLARVNWTVNDPANAGRLCAGTYLARESSTAITGDAVTFRYTMTDCQGGSWEGGANLRKIAGTN